MHNITPIPETREASTFNVATLLSEKKIYNFHVHKNRSLIFMDLYHFQYQMHNVILRFHFMLPFKLLYMLKSLMSNFTHFG